MKKLTVGSCFSGIGGIELGLEWTGGFETKWQIENDPYALAVLQKHWPKVVRHTDIRTISQVCLEDVDVICGGYPCQPFSLAGQRKGESDDLNLWPYMRRAVLLFRPKWVLLENVPGHLSMGFGRVLGDLAELGYDAEWGLLSAAGVGAPHLRKRLFVIAHSAPNTGRTTELEQSSGAISDADGVGRNGRSSVAGETRAPSTPTSGRDWWKSEPDVGGRIDGFPVWLYRHTGRGLSYAESQRRTEVLYQLWTPNVAQAIQRCFGGLGRLEAAEILFSFVREYESGRRISREQLESAKALEGVLREMWGERAATRSPQGPRQDEQHTGKHRDSLRSLSRFASPWEAGIDRVAKLIPKRVDRLRCLGNAVVPQVAQKVGEMILKWEEKRSLDE